MLCKLLPVYTRKIGPNLLHVWDNLFFFQMTFWNVLKFKIIEPTYGAFTLDVKSVLNENLGGILGGI